MEKSNSYRNQISDYVHQGGMTKPQWKHNYKCKKKKKGPVHLKTSQTYFQ